MNLFKKKKSKICSKCENDDYFTEYFNRQYTDKKLYGSKGCYKIVMQTKYAVADSDEQNRIKNVEKLIHI